MEANLRILRLIQAISTAAASAKWDWKKITFAKVDSFYLQLNKEEQRKYIFGMSERHMTFKNSIRIEFMTHSNIIRKTISWELERMKILFSSSELLKTTVISFPYSEYSVNLKNKNRLLKMSLFVNQVWFFPIHDLWNTS